MNSPYIGKLASSSVIKRYLNNPILDASRVPYPTALVFNAGVTKFNGKYVMVFRNDYGSLEQQTIEAHHTTDLGVAFSDDGIHWEVQPKPCFKLHDQEIIRAYDPRLTVIDGRCYMCFAVDTQHGIRGGVAVTDDFEEFEILSLSTPDLRNMVLFPEKIGGKFMRLERPFTVYSRGGVDRFDMWISESPDLRYWGNSDLLLAVEDVPFANDKIGPAAPPIKTEQGWLTTFHAVDIDPTRGKNGWETSWQKRYTAGLMLLDLENPKKIIGMYQNPLLAPEASYEIEGGFRNNVIFPGGMVLEDDGEVKIYYGAADTIECLATAHIDDLIQLCLKG
ncbi:MULTISPECIES: glycoside hydrolase family 130 protein [unclassified Paenibacillus]|uniref:glycoside hydrolase family 130 protein n=1 Tax=unclassified Paenibacillus TaxID=185978 RepID=UPI0009A6516A|nr:MULTISPECIES: glycoside hydrolase family 130 protein [unclassified Paenibacillus]SLJ88409.1 beta-1,4-mannooligosaccharide/beta-1,4-mannosyl-N-acetylglucosamine phosphorylase [Paenibacillus sp. RU5A]SOC63806.1 beta-1,4-mannooligosaccharide/beta-1,4-mannosyl-N-acetylglucosamine phosphorylase [Paenibacillus sp. RU26A]SOC68556.1 beta-1,4-mannooligosaccharide/beta-1,4-mannosyl-N-acetylglucosamine phosphorylase [Paenibacillus sp. RU5M]